MKTPTQIIMLASITSTIAFSTVAEASIISTFDSGSEGWSTINDAMNFRWDGSIGNPGGAIRAADQRNGTNWYFAGSNAYHGDLGSYYGGSISWDTLGISGNQNPLNRADLMIVGGGVRIGINTDLLPVNGEWVSWTTNIIEGEWAFLNSQSSGVLSDVFATEAQIRQVLSNVTGFYVRGEYAFGGDSSAIDNVALVPTPGSIGILTAGLFAATRRRR